MPKDEQTEIISAMPEPRFIERRTEADASPAYEDVHIMRLRYRCFSGIMLTGAAAGMVMGIAREASLRGLVLEGVFSMVVLLICGFLGSFLGMLLRASVLYAMHRRVERDDFTVDGMVLGSLAGGFLGLIVALMAWPAMAHVFVACGGMFGGFAGALPGEGVGILARMIVAEELARKRA